MKNETTEAEKKEYDKFAYDRLTEVFTKHGLQYRDAPEAYDLLTWIRSGFEGWYYGPGMACSRSFVDSLLEAIGLLADAMNRMRGSVDERTEA